MKIPWFRGGAALAAACAAFAVAAGNAAATPDSRLLATYQPVTQLDPLESFRPSSVQSFIADASLEQLVAPATWSVVEPDPEPGDLPGPGAGVFRLNQDSCTPSASLGGLACYAASADEGSGGPVVYGRVAHEADRIVLQYWYFYYDDVYSYAYPPSDFVWQAHEGDWEVVNVVLSGDEEPLFAGYSQHCSGERRSWDSTALTLVDGTHPLVHVAIGSHANYFTAGVHPIATKCIPPAALAFFVNAKLPLPADYAFEGDLSGPPGIDGPATPIHKIGGNGAPWLDFAGFWGELQYFHAPIGTFALGTSPVGPAFHSVWVDPLGTLATWTAT
jgi:hypothetical protein